MIRLLADENFNADIVRGVLLRTSDVDVVKAQDVGLRSAKDPAVLDWAARNDRIVLTHDRNTMIDFAKRRMADFLDMPGLFVVHNRLPFGPLIEDIALIAKSSQQAEWRNLIVFFPL